MSTSCLLVAYSDFLSYNRSFRYHMRGSWDHILSLSPYEGFLKGYFRLYALYEGLLEPYSWLLVPYEGFPELYSGLLLICASESIFKLSYTISGAIESYLQLLAPYEGFL